jgi:hypothetical protein
MPTMGETFWYCYSRYTIIFLHACTLHNCTYARIIVQWILFMKPDFLKSCIASGTVVHDLDFERKITSGGSVNDVHTVWPT